MKNFRDRLGRELLLMDGAMGTMLQSRGLKLGELPGSMNLRAPSMPRTPPPARTSSRPIRSASAA